MLLSNLKNSFDGMRGENKFLRLILFAMTVALIASSCSAMKKDQIITVVPPTLTETAWVSKTQSSSEYTTAWAMYVSVCADGFGVAARKVREADWNSKR